MTIINQEPPVTECPDWCRYTARDHGWREQTPDGLPCRPHVIDIGTVEPSTEEHRPLDNVLVCLEQMETLNKPAASTAGST